MLELPLEKLTNGQQTDRKPPFFFKKLNYSLEGFNFVKFTEFNVGDSMGHLNRVSLRFCRLIAMSDLYLVFTSTAKINLTIILRKNCSFSNSIIEIQEERTLPYIIDNTTFTDSKDYQFYKFLRLVKSKNLEFVFKTPVLKILINLDQVIVMLVNGVFIYTPLGTSFIETEPIDIAINRYLYILTATQISIYKEELITTIDINHKCNFIVPTTSHIFLIRMGFIFKISESRANVFDIIEPYFDCNLNVNSYAYDDNNMYLATKHGIYKVNLYDKNVVEVFMAHIGYCRIVVNNDIVVLYSQGSSCIFIKKTDFSVFSLRNVDCGLSKICLYQNNIVYALTDEIRVFEYKIVGNDLLPVDYNINENVEYNINDKQKGVGKITYAGDKGEEFSYSKIDTTTNKTMCSNTEDNGYNSVNGQPDAAVDIGAGTYNNTKMDIRLKTIPYNTVDGLIGHVDKTYNRIDPYCNAQDAVNTDDIDNERIMNCNVDSGYKKHKYETISSLLYTAELKGKENFSSIDHKISSDEDRKRKYLNKEDIHIEQKNDDAYLIEQHQGTKTDGCCNDLTSSYNNISGNAPEDKHPIENANNQYDIQFFLKKPSANTDEPPENIKNTVNQYDVHRKCNKSSSNTTEDDENIENNKSMYDLHAQYNKSSDNTTKDNKNIANPKSMYDLHGKYNQSSSNTTEDNKNIEKNTSQYSMSKKNNNFIGNTTEDNLHIGNNKSLYSMFKKNNNYSGVTTVDNQNIENANNQYNLYRKYNKSAVDSVDNESIENTYCYNEFSRDYNNVRVNTAEDVQSIKNAFEITNPKSYYGSSFFNKSFILFKILIKFNNKMRNKRSLGVFQKPITDEFLSTILEVADNPTLIQSNLPPVSQVCSQNAFELIPSPLMTQNEELINSKDNLLSSQSTENIYNSIQHNTNNESLHPFNSMLYNEKDKKRFKHRYKKVKFQYKKIIAKNMLKNVEDSVSDESSYVEELFLDDYKESCKNVIVDVIANYKETEKNYPNITDEITAFNYFKKISKRMGVYNLHSAGYKIDCIQSNKCKNFIIIRRSSSYQKTLFFTENFYNFYKIYHQIRSPKEIETDYLINDFINEEFKKIVGYKKSSTKNKTKVTNENLKKNKSGF